jgi:hypothetical protein
MSLIATSGFGWVIHKSDANGDGLCKPMGSEGLKAMGLDRCDEVVLERLGGKCIAPLGRKVCGAFRG